MRSDKPGDSAGDRRFPRSKAEPQCSGVCGDEGEEPMTGPQASYLETLCREAGEAFEPSLTKAQASELIERLQGQTGRAPRARADACPQDAGSSAPYGPWPVRQAAEQRAANASASSSRRPGANAFSDSRPEASANVSAAAKVSPAP